jgi:hypothetical protein
VIPFSQPLQPSDSLRGGLLAHSRVRLTRIENSLSLPHALGETNAQRTFCRGSEVS